VERRYGSYLLDHVLCSLLIGRHEIDEVAFEAAMMAAGAAEVNGSPYTEKQA
jgi:hypothetical protein